MSARRPGAPRPPSVAAAAVALAAAKLGLAVLGLGRFKKLIERLTAARPVTDAIPAGLPAETARRVAVAAAFYPGRALCLEQSVTLYLLLRRRGLPVDLRLGVHVYPFLAHAWVEHAGTPLNESPEYVATLLPLAAGAR